MISIRLAIPGDVPSLPAIESVACALFEAIPATAALPPYLTGIEDFAEAQEQGLLWVAETAAGALVGFALAERLDGALHLEELDVLPEHGRQGIGTRLVGALCDRARVLGVAVTLCTFREVPWNAPFYQRLGFRALRDEELTPGLVARIRVEEKAGLPRELRVAMRLETG